MIRDEHEPVRGLPEPLPPGERLLWQGSPSWTALARRALHVGQLAVYFGLLLLWRAASGLAGGEDPAALALAVAKLTLLALTALAVLSLIAWMTARVTVYTVTSARVVLRFGVALPLVINLPFKRVAAAAFRTYPDGTGDIPLRLVAGDSPRRLGYLHLWPHARPWRLRSPEPMLRCVPDAERAAAVLARALAAAASRPVQAVPSGGSERPAAAGGGLAGAAAA